MKIWEKLLAVNVREKEKYELIFEETVNSLQKQMKELRKSIREEKEYYTITEEDIKGGWLIQIVPKEIYSLYQEMREKLPNEFLGFSVRVGKYEGRNVRVSCFGVKCSHLGKSLTKH